MSWILESSARCLLYVIALLVALRVRASISKLSDSDLSRFLSMSVIKGGLIIGLGQLVFLAFSSVQCLNEASIEGHDWTECKRSLYSQTGLGSLVGLHTIIMFVSGIAPRKYIDRHIIKKGESDCPHSDHPWRECKRSFYSQTGLGGLVALYTIIELVSGITPRKYIDRHIVKPKKIATMDLNLEEVRCYAKGTLQY